MKLSVVIVNYNVKYFLEQCLCAVVKAAASMDAEIFVVDNHSTDGSKEYLEKKFPSVCFKWNADNAGFAKANNSVLKETNGDYILFLNPDTIVPEDCFEKCIRFFEATPACGAVGVRMIDGAGYFLKESKRSFPSPSTSFYKMSGLSQLFPRSAVFARYYAGNLPEFENHEVEVLAGAFMMLTREAIGKSGGFDDHFFMYAEDIDLSYRLKKLGFKNFYLADTTIIHFKGESTQKESRNYTKHFYGAMQLFVKKHYSEKRWTYFFMTIAIWCSKTLATIAKKFQQPKSIAKTESLLVVADQPYFNEMIQLIKFAAVPRIITGRIAVSETDKDAATGKLGNLAAIIEKSRAAELLFCEGALSFATIIQYMQELKGKINFLVHAKHSNSIVGSNDKNSNGIFIAKE